MRRPSARILLAASFGLLTLGTAAARGDDWPQFRKDGGRTGASLDKTRFPVTDVWTWSTRSANGESPTFDTAVIRGRIFFSALENKTRYLVCADAKTGALIWRQPLVEPNLTMRGIPAVTNSGKVFTYDFFPGKLPPSGLNQERRPSPRNVPIGTSPGEIGGFVVRAFDAATGLNLANLPIEFVQLEEDLAEIVMRPAGSKSPPVRNSDRPIPELGPLGTPLLIGDELHAFTSQDIYLRWMPGRRVIANRVIYDANEFPAEFWGFPPVATAGGVFVADDQRKYRFCGVLGGEQFRLWVNDLQNSIGVPASRDETLCVGLGHLGSTNALISLDSASGLPRWMYAPMGLAASTMNRQLQRLAKYRSEIVFQGNERDRNRTGGAGADATSFRIVRHPMVYEDLRPSSIYPPGHESSAGVVLTEKHVFAEVSGAIVGLERGSGNLLWRQPLPGLAYTQSLVGSRDHIIACYTLPVSLKSRSPAAGGSHRRESRRRITEQIPYWDRGTKASGSRHLMVAYRIRDGVKVWEQETLQPASFSLSEGLIYAGNRDLTAYGPAERTYRIADNTDEPKAYVTPLSVKEELEPKSEEPVATSPAETERIERKAAEEKEPEAVAAEARADISILRLTYDTPLVNQLEQVQDRVKLLEPKKVPLILQLDWLNPARDAVRGAPTDVLTPIPQAFVARCVRLAREGAPLYFDLAPEVNVYLRRYPERSGAVLELLTQAAQAVRQASKGCQVMISFNTEVLFDAYGKGMINPFGKLPKTDLKTEPQLLAQLARLGDAVGLSTRPYAGFRNAGVLPPDYLLRARKLFDPMPLLVTRIVIDADVRGAIVRGERAEYARRILQACYWLNARVVAQAELTGYPEMAVGEDGGKKDPIRQIAAKWQGVLTWPIVGKLTAAPPTHLPEALDPTGAPAIQ